MIVILLLLLLITSETLFSENLEDVELERLLDLKISTASKYEQTILEAPSSVTIITSDEIKLFGYRTLANALMKEKSFYSRYDRVYRYMGVRGIDLMTSYNNTILLMLDGHILNDNVYNAPFYENEYGINLDLVERIEIVRGPGSSLYGNGAMITVINIITKTGQKIDGVGFDLSAGSYGRKEGKFYFGKRLNNGIDFILNASIGDIKGQDLYFKEYDDSLTNYGWAKGLDWEKFYSFNTKICYKDFSFSALFSNREKAIPTALWGMNFNQGEPLSIDNRTFFNLGYKYTINEQAKIDLNAFFDYYAFKGVYSYDTIDYDSNDGKWIGVETKLTWDLSSSNRLIAGFEFRNNFKADYRLWNEFDSVRFDQNFPYNIYSAYVQDHHQFLSWLGLNAGLRYDYYTTSGGSLNPRISVIMNLLKKSALKLIFGTSFRAPNIYEMYYTDNKTAIPNPNLKPEKLSIFETVFEHNLSNTIFYSISYFNMNMKDMIYQVINEKDSMLQFQNVESVFVNGLEFEAKYYKKDFLSYFNLSTQIAKNKNTNQQFENSPNIICKIGASYNLFDYLNLSFEGYYEDGRLSAKRNRIPSYWLANAYICFHPPINEWIGIDAFKELNISLKLNNLFDKKYGLPCGLDHLQELIPQDGRNFLFSFKIKF